MSDGLSGDQVVKRNDAALAIATVVDELIGGVTTAYAIYDRFISPLAAENADLRQQRDDARLSRDRLAEQVDSLRQQLENSYTS